MTANVPFKSQLFFFFFLGSDLAAHSSPVLYVFIYFFNRVQEMDSTALHLCPLLIFGLGKLS